MSSHIFQVTKIGEGPKFAVYRLYIHGVDSTPETELSDEVVIDPRDFTPPQDAKAAIAIDQIWYDVTGFIVRLKFDGAPNNPVWALSDSNNYHDFRPIGGLQDVGGADSTGKLLLDTVGLSEASSKKLGALIIKVRKG